MRNRAVAVFWSLITAWLLLQWLLVAGLPLLSEDWTHREMVGGFASFFDCFDRSHPPPRPLQHVFFWVMGEAPPWAMRLPAFAMHFGSILVVAALAARAGLSPWRARLAAALFAAFPAVRALAWPAAISGPGHVLFELLAVWCFARGRRGAWATAAAVAACTLVATAWHPSAVLTPILLVAWRALLTPGEGGAVRRALRSLREPAVLAALLVAVLMLVWIVPAPGPRGGVRELGAIAANTARAMLFWLPELLRVGIVDSLRGSGVHRIVGLLALVLIAARAVSQWRRGGALWRFALLVIAVDLGLTVVKTGFSMRYAMLPSAMLAIAIAGVQIGWRARFVAFALVGALVVMENHTAVGEFVEAGRDADELLAAAQSMRSEIAPSQVLWIVDPPPDMGLDGDIPVWNWGLRQALRARGVDGVRPITTRRSITAGTDVERVDEAFVQRVMDDPATAALRWHPGGLERKLPAR